MVGSDAFSYEKCPFSRGHVSFWGCFITKIYAYIKYINIVKHNNIYIYTYNHTSSTHKLHIYGNFTPYRSDLSHHWSSRAGGHPSEQPKKSATSKVVEPTHLKNMLVKLEIFPKDRGENKTIDLKPPMVSICQFSWLDRAIYPILCVGQPTWNSWNCYPCYLDSWTSQFLSTKPAKQYFRYRWKKHQYVRRQVRSISRLNPLTWPYLQEWSGKYKMRPFLLLCMGWNEYSGQELKLPGRGIHPQLLPSWFQGWGGKSQC